MEIREVRRSCAKSRARGEKCDKKRSVGIYMKETFGIDIAENTTWGKNAFAKGVGGLEMRSLERKGTEKGTDGRRRTKRITTSLRQVPKDNKKDNEMEEKCIMDVEDLLKEGKKKGGPCPYFLARDDTRRRGVFAPYSYILDAGVRRAALDETVINWQKSIVIFDEAHNAESACEEAASRDLTAVHIANAIKDADEAFQFWSLHEEGMAGMSEGEKNDEMKKSTYPNRTASDYLTLRGIFAALEREIAIVCAQDQESVRKGETLPSSRDGWFIFDLLGKVNINMDTYSQITQVCEDASTLLSFRAAEIGKGLGAGLERVKEFLERAFEAKYKGLIECYRSRVGPPEEDFSSTWNKKKDEKEKGPTVSFWCMVPGVIVNELCELGVKSLLLASGTLSRWIRSPQPARFSSVRNPHVIPQENVGRHVSEGPSNSVSLNPATDFEIPNSIRMSLVC